MKQNLADVDTMMFFDEVVEAHENMLLSKMADAVAECRTADKMAAVLSEDGEVGLLRLLEIWAGMQDGKEMAVLEGSPAHLLADVLAQVYAYVILHPFRDPVGLALYVEMQHMMDSLMLGEWFE